MLWIKGKVTAVNIIQSTIIPSIICMVIPPLLYASFKLKGNVLINDNRTEDDDVTTSYERNFIFFLGVLGLLFVPIFKLITDLPPYMGMLLSLGVIWIVTEILHRNKIYETRKKLTVIGIKKLIYQQYFFS